MAIYLYFASAVFLCCIATMLFLVRATQPGLHDKRLTDIVGDKSSAPNAFNLKRLSTGFALIAGKVRGGFSAASTESTVSRLALAGIRTPAAIDIYFGARVLSPLAGAFFGTFAPSNTAFWVCCLCGVGYLMPDILLRQAIRRRQARIRKAIPDTIDLLVICVEAGLGLDQALMRVIHEIGLSHPDLHQELLRMQQEQRVGRPRTESWQALGERTNIQELKSLASMIVQTERFGTPVAKALSIFSDDLRTRRRQLAEEAAEKTRIKIIFPLVFCIFPCLFIVLLAPALLALFAELSGLGK